MTPRVSELVIQEFVHIVNQKQSSKTALLRIENNSIYVKIAIQDVLIIILTKHVVKILILQLYN